MSQICRIVVTTGPERGKVFELEEELVHIGRAPENQIVLEDPGLSEHQATILHKNGRFAIYRPDEADVEVDGSQVPSEQWVWLPIEARLQFGRRTSCQFSYEPDAESAATDRAPVDAESHASATEGSSGNHDSSSSESSGRKSRSGRRSGESGKSSRRSVKAPPLPEADAGESASEDEAAAEADSRNGNSRSRSAEKKKKKKRKKQVARFITDQGGPMVELGADGNLPELTLQDGPATKSKRDKPKASSSVVLYSVLGFSMLASLGMLFLDASPATVSETSKADARKELVRFFGIEEAQIAQREREMKADRRQRWPWPSNKKPVALMGQEGEPARWQMDLRAARIARTRADITAERASYRRVLDQLNAEDHHQHFGLTGHAPGDAELKRLVSIAISR